MSFKIPCGGFKLDEKSFSLDENGVLSVSGGGGGLPSGGTLYQRLVMGEDGNVRWATVNSVIHRDSRGRLRVDSRMEEIDGYPAPIKDMMSYGSISLVDDVNGVIAPCISACNTGLGYYILTFMCMKEPSQEMIKIKVVGGVLADDKISIIEPES